MPNEFKRMTHGEFRKDPFLQALVKCRDLKNNRYSQTIIQRAIDYGVNTGKTKDAMVIAIEALSKSHDRFEKMCIENAQAITKPYVVIPK